MDKLLLQVLIDDYSLFKSIFKIDFNKYNPQTQKLRSPFREDNSPGCYFISNGDDILFVDWADDPTHRSIWDYYERIGGDFDNIIIPKIEKTYRGNFPKEFKLILYSKRLFNEEDSNFWDPITIKDLEDDRVFAISDFTFKSKKGWINIRADKLAYALTEDFTYKVKIYQPLNEKFKWIGNFTKNEIFGLNNLKFQSETLYITSGYKDNRCLIKIGKESIAFQNEGIYPDVDTINPILKRYKKVVIIYDNDQAGRKAAKKIKKLINSSFPKKATVFNLPEFNGKDVFEYSVCFGLNKLKTLIK